MSKGGSVRNAVRAEAPGGGAEWTARSTWLRVAVGAGPWDPHTRVTCRRPLADPFSLVGEVDNPAPLLPALGPQTGKLKVLSEKAAREYFPLGAESHEVRTEKVAAPRSHRPAPHPESHVSRRYRAFREDDGQYSRTYWHLLAIRLAFVIVFEVAGPLPSPLRASPAVPQPLHGAPHPPSPLLTPWPGGVGVTPAGEPCRLPLSPRSNQFSASHVSAWGRGLIPACPFLGGVAVTRARGSVPGKLHGPTEAVGRHTHWVVSVAGTPLLCSPAHVWAHAGHSGHSFCLWRAPSPSPDLAPCFPARGVLRGPGPRPPGA